jgi:broad specificity phosphatase PhoE
MTIVETTIHTIRHAHTDYNSEKRYAGSIDIPLNLKGLQDSEKAAVMINRLGLQFDVVITSTMNRAIQTAKILVKDNPIVQTKLCNERGFGVMEGHTWEEVQHFDPPVLMIDVGNDLHTVNPQGGEPFEDVWFRAKRFRNYLFRNYQGKNILIVSHGVFLQMLHGVLKGSNCIESLGSYPANLELASFCFTNKQLTTLKITKLTSADGVKF